ncbi:hypothetical protein ABI59_01030 [Acidobacteria bacterium Mor1]|nr:hypothetical protein ABI59_01030 [Acidobacteria bacterium Mor1]
MSTEEWSEVRLLANRYAAFLRIHSHDPVQFSPRINGWGVLPTGEADLAVGDTLFEVKTVNRNIAGKDLRQLLIYLALTTTDTDHRWEYGGFLNPRRSLWYKFSVDSVVRQISGGYSPREVFRELLSYFDERDITLDTRF